MTVTINHTFFSIIQSIKLINVSFRLLCTQLTVLLLYMRAISCYLLSTDIGKEESSSTQNPAHSRPALIQSCAASAPAKDRGVIGAGTLFNVGGLYRDCQSFVVPSGLAKFGKKSLFQNQKKGIRPTAISSQKQRRRASSLSSRAASTPHTYRQVESSRDGNVLLVGFLCHPFRRTSTVCRAIWKRELPVSCDSN